MSQQARPSISVVVPTFNASAWIIDVLTSVAEQTVLPDEVIVVDDGSSDGTADLVRERFPAVRLVATDNFGRSAARNLGLAVATSEWVSFLDHDDLFHREKVEAVGDYIVATPGCQALNHLAWCFAEAPGVTSPFGMQIDFVAQDAVGCHHQVALHPELVNSFEHIDVAPGMHSQMDRSRGIVSATVIRRDLAIRAGGFPVYAAGGEDWMFFVQVARFADWHTIPQALAFVRCHPSQGTYDGDAAAGVLAVKVGAWLSGRPLRRRTAPSAIRSAMVAHHDAYRYEVRAHVVGALRRRELRQAWRLWRLGSLLLPRLRDRTWTVAPRRSWMRRLVP